jgi:hypothetical protein
MNWLSVFSNNVIMSVLVPYLDTKTCFRFASGVSKALAAIIFWSDRQDWESIFQWKLRIRVIFYSEYRRLFSRYITNDDVFYNKLGLETSGKAFYRKYLAQSCLPADALDSKQYYMCLGGCGTKYPPNMLIARRFCKYNYCRNCHEKEMQAKPMMDQIGGIIGVAKAQTYHREQVIEKITQSVFGVIVASLPADSQERFKAFVEMHTQEAKFKTFYEPGAMGMFSKYAGNGFIEENTLLMNNNRIANCSFVFFSAKYIEGCIDYSFEKILWLLKTDWCKIVFNLDRGEPPQLDNILGAKRRKII